MTNSQCAYRLADCPEQIQVSEGHSRDGAAKLNFHVVKAGGVSHEGTYPECVTGTGTRDLGLLLCVSSDFHLSSSGFSVGAG